jgi:hypothetical protein
MSGVTIQNIDGNLKVEGSFPQTQASLYEQLKEVRHVAIAIGCYDVSDLLMEKIEKIESSASEGVYTPEVHPMCHKCHNKIVQEDMLNSDCNEVVGCTLIKKRTWDKNGNEACPMLKK